MNPNSVNILLLPNTGHLQQVEDYVRVCLRQLKIDETIYRFHTLVFDRDSSLDDLNWDSYDWTVINSPRNIYYSSGS
jgi:hypothetical protein